MVGAKTFMTLGPRSDLLGFQDPEYIKALNEALPQNLEVSFDNSRDTWIPLVKWVKLLAALSQRRTLLTGLPMEIL